MSENYKKSMSVSGLPSTYALGCYARNITIYSQQVRAINLVRQLADEIDGRELAVVGGGAAGITAAAEAVSHGAKVTLFESQSHVMQLQRRCRHRWVHPHIYDWPHEGALDNAANLPVLTWEADTARGVAFQIVSGWRLFCSKHPDSLKVELGSRVTKVAPAAGHGVEVSWDGPEPGQSESQNYDVLILAIGFGVESSGSPGARRYWTDDSFDLGASDKKILISGFGDGAFADLMRLCLRDFKQHEIVDLVKDVPAEVADALIDHENKAKGSGDESALNDYYERLSVPSVIERLEERRRSDLAVTINGRAESLLFGTTSSILNRFIVSQLRQLDLFRVEKCDLDLPIEGRHNDYRVTLEGRASEPYHEVVLRHGPRPAMREFDPEIWKDAAATREMWRKLPQALDQTCRPGWKVSPPPESDALSNANCLVIRSQADETASHKITQSLEGAISKLPTALARQLGTPLFRFSEELLADLTALEKAVKLLCNAEVVVFDATNFEPATMLLLGIRSVVRRGVTILSIGGNYSIGDRISIPFNIEDANIVSHSKKQYDRLATDPPTLLKRRISRGLEQLSTPYYLDLSVFDAIRNIPTGDRGIVADEEGVLVLCSFDSKYTKKFWKKQLQPGLKDQLDVLRRDQVDDRTASIGVVRSFELESPRLVSQTIYEYVRRMQTCVIDWTNWSPNVFFELGIRLAASKNRTSSIIERGHRECMEILASGDPAENWDKVKDDPYFLAASKTPRNTSSARRIAIAKQAVKLLDLFDVIEYDAKRERLENASCFEEMYGVNALDHQSVSIITSTNARIYGMVESHIDVDSQPSAWAVHHELSNSAASFGRDQSSGKSVSLYPGNSALLAGEQSAEFERLLATWFYLTGRYGSDRCHQDKTLFEVFSKTVSRLMEAYYFRLKSDQSLVGVLRALKDEQEKIVRKKLLAHS